MTEQSKRVNSLPEITNEGRIRIHWGDMTFIRLSTEKMKYVQPDDVVIVHHESDVGGHPRIYRGHIHRYPRDLGVDVVVDEILESYGNHGIPKVGESVEVSCFHLFVQEEDPSE